MLHTPPKYLCCATDWKPGMMTAWQEMERCSQASLIPEVLLYLLGLPCWKERPECIVYRERRDQVLVYYDGVPSHIEDRYEADELMAF